MSRPDPKESTVNSWISDFPELQFNGKELHCVSCKKNISWKRKSNVVEHVSSDLHKNGANGLTDSDRQKQFNLELTEMMAGCNIPWKKLDNPLFRQFLEKCISGHYSNVTVPSQSSLQGEILKCSEKFQSIESATNNRLRYARSPGYHARIHSQVPPSVHYNGSSSNIRLPHMGRSLEMIAPGHTPTARNNNSPTSKLKCGVWIFFAVVTFFLAAAKYYFHGINIGVEALVFCSLLVIVLIIGGLISLCEAITSYSPSHTPIDAQNVAVPEQQEAEETHNQVPTSALPQNSSEMPPPPYHIAVMLSPTTDLDAIQVIRDSPPPSYEKVVT